MVCYTVKDRTLKGTQEADTQKPVQYRCNIYTTATGHTHICVLQAQIDFESVLLLKSE
jgi:hypothetical protein